MNPYEVLGISPESQEEDIKKAYKELAKKWHPDVNKDNPEAEEKFKEISGAFETLKNNNWSYEERSNGIPGINFNFGDAFSSLFGQFGFDPFQANKRTVRRRRVQFAISFEEAFNGCSKKVNINEDKQCSICNGHGLIFGTDYCKTCSGSGRIRHSQGATSIIATCSACKGFGKENKGVCKECLGAGKKVENKEITISIPPGTRQGSILQPERDLEVVIVFRPHDKFVLLNDGVDIGSGAVINIFDAMLGKTIDVETLNGIKKLKVPPGIQPNTVLRIKNGGFNRQNNMPGDHLIEIHIEIPKDLTEEQKEEINKLKKFFEVK